MAKLFRGLDTGVQSSCLHHHLYHMCPQLVHCLQQADVDFAVQQHLVLVPNGRLPVLPFFVPDVERISISHEHQEKTRLPRWA